jgi:Toprim domain
MRQAEAHQVAERCRRRELARWLWRKSVPAAGTIVERYLAGRSILAVPPTIRFLRARGGHPAAMLAAFGLADVQGVHITHLSPDGTKLGKIMLGPTAGNPIVLAPPNDLGGLAIAEGIETALSAAQEGLGAWAAGSAGHMPKLAGVIAPLLYVEAVTILAEDDDAGRRGAEDLAGELIRLRPDIEARTL